MKMLLIVYYGWGRGKKKTNVISVFKEGKKEAPGEIQADQPKETTEHISLEAGKKKKKKRKAILTEPTWISDA